MKPLALALLLLSSALAERMAFSAPSGTVSQYRTEGNTQTSFVLVSVKSLDGKGVPAGLEQSLSRELPPSSIFNAESTHTVLERDADGGAKVAVDGWNRSSILLLPGPRWGVTYTLRIAPEGKVRAENVQVKLLERGTPLPEGTQANFDKAVIEGQKSGVLLNAATTEPMYAQDFEVGQKRRVTLTAAQVGSSDRSGPQTLDYGDVTLLGRTPSGGYRFLLDVDNTRYEKLPQTRYAPKVYARSFYTFLPDGRLERAETVSSTLVRLDETPATVDYQGRRFEVVKALRTRSSSTTELVQGR